VIVDTHQHFWDLAREPMPWMRPEHEAIARPFAPDDLRPLLEACGIEATILVQAANTDADTDAMFEQAAAHPWIRAVTAWVDLSSSERTRARLHALQNEPGLRGIRHLIHEEEDPHWILRDRVLESLAIVEEHALVLELPCVFPHHLGDVAELARTFPALTIVIDHLGKPPLRSERMDDWSSLIRDAAGSPNVAAKISGLYTTIATPWEAGHAREAVEISVDAFGPDRLMCGSDWPVCLLNGEYKGVWGATVEIVTEVAGEQAAQRILEDTPTRIYRIGDAAEATTHSTLGGAHGRSH
jgi:L-fuconolactonase